MRTHFSVNCCEDGCEMKLEKDQTGWSVVHLVDSYSAANRLTAAIWMLMACAAAVFYGIVRFVLAWR